MFYSCDGGFSKTWELALRKKVIYDAIGNPLSDGTWTYSWEHGRQLKQMTNGSTTANFTYNHDGIRVKKVINGVTTNIYVHGNQVVHQTGSNGHSFHFYYDASGRVSEIRYNGAAYGVIHNLQGDVIGLIDNTGAEVVRYVYDSWGKVLSVTGSMASTLGAWNPIRYRGYYYDVETEMYYLRSRYYNPACGRFPNADSILDGVNLFCYCRNNPIILLDDNGTEVNTTNCRQLRVRSTPYVRTDNLITCGPTNLKMGTQVEILFSAKGSALNDKGSEAERSNKWYYIYWYDEGYHSGYVHSSCIDGENYSKSRPNDSLSAFGPPDVEITMKATGCEVYNIQMILYHQGFLSIDQTDGYFGKITKGAVIEFQKKYSLKADGIVGPETKKWLYNVGKTYLEYDGVCIPNG